MNYSLNPFILKQLDKLIFILAIVVIMVFIGKFFLPVHIDDKLHVFSNFGMLANLYG